MVWAVSRAPATRSMVRSRVARIDWWASRRVVSVTRTGPAARSSAANFSGPTSSRRWRDPAGGWPARAGSLEAGLTLVGAGPWGRWTVTSARYRSSRVARLAPTDAAVSAGRSSMKLVVTGPDRNCSSPRMACR